MTEHDRIRQRRALECNRDDIDAVAEALVGLQSTDNPDLLPLYEEFMELYQDLKAKQEKD